MVLGSNSFGETTHGLELNVDTHTHTDTEGLGA